MVHRSLEMTLYNFLTADGRPQTASLDKNRRRPSAVGGQICKVGVNHAHTFILRRQSPGKLLLNS
jgi:hypothetical protein